MLMCCVQCLCASIMRVRVHSFHACIYMRACMCASPRMFMFACAQNMDAALQRLGLMRADLGHTSCGGCSCMQQVQACARSQKQGPDAEREAEKTAAACGAF